jgi:hypothetical protein
MTAQREIEELRRKAASAISHIVVMEQDSAGLSARIIKAKSDLNRINQHIATLSARGENKEVRVSDHALLRYIERAMGVDLDEFRAAILTEQNRKAIEFAGDCTIKSNGVEFIVKNRTVVTVIAKGAA